MQKSRLMWTTRARRGVANAVRLGLALREASWLALDLSRRRNNRAYLSHLTAQIVRGEREGEGSHHTTPHSFLCLLPSPIVGGNVRLLFGARQLETKVHDTLTVDKLLMQSYRSTWRTICRYVQMSQHIELIYLLSAIRDSIRLRRDEVQINFVLYGAEGTFKKKNWSIGFVSFVD